VRGCRTRTVARTGLLCHHCRGLAHDGTTGGLVSLFRLRGFEGDVPRLVERFRPVFAEKLTESDQPVSFGAGPEPVAGPCLLQGSLGIAGVQVLQTAKAVPLIRTFRRAEQAEIALAPAASVGPPLVGAAGRAAHVALRLDRHRDMQ